MPSCSCRDPLLGVEHKVGYPRKGALHEPTGGGGPRALVASALLLALLTDSGLSALLLGQLQRFFQVPKPPQLKKVP